MHVLRFRIHEQFGRSLQERHSRHAHLSCVLYADQKSTRSSDRCTMFRYRRRLYREQPFFQPLYAPRCRSFHLHDTTLNDYRQMMIRIGSIQSVKAYPTLRTKVKSRYQDFPFRIHHLLWKIRRQLRQVLNQLFCSQLRKGCFWHLQGVT